MAATVTGILLTGVHASRPSSGVSAGTLYSCTTHSLIYQTSDTGSTWATWATIGTTSTTVATDTIWDAKGDLAGGTGADTAAKLTVGANGTILYADSTQTTGLKWVALQAGSATRTAGDLTTTSTTFTDATGMSVTLTTGARRCLITVQANGKNANAAHICLDIDIDGSRQGQTFGLAFGNGTTAGQNFPLSFSFVTAALSAASHTFKLQWRVDSGTGTLYASTGVSPLSIQVVELPI